jgi:hypothetical protein
MRKGYNTYLYRGTGVVSSRPSPPLIIGLSVHKGMEMLLTTGDIEAAVDAALSEYGPLSEKLDTYPREEHEALVHALVRGWHRARYEAFIDEFEVLQIEKEVRALLAPGLVLAARADAVVKRRLDGLVFVWNWKTTGNKTDWTEQWEDDIQMWTEALAIEDDLNVPVAGVIVEGLFKGATRGGQSTSPLLMGYKRLVGDREVYRSGWEKGWTKFPAWREQGGLGWWIPFLPLDVVEEQFVRSQPILKNNDVVRGWIEEVVQREMDISHHLEGVEERDKERFFWRNFSKWNCRWCSFKPACKGRTTIWEMVDAGLLTERVDHHAIKPSS